MYTLIKLIGLLSFTGSITFLSFLIIRKLLANFVSANWFYRGILILTLFWMIPLWFHTSILSFDKDFEVTVKSQQLGDMVATAVQPIAMFQDVDLFWIAVAYCVVAMILLIRFVFLYNRQCKFFLRGSWDVKKEGALALLNELRKEYQIRPSVRLCVSQQLTTPILIGFLRYVIILPDYSLNENQLQFVLRHELIHLKRWDNRWKVGIAILKCIHWFNPVVYLLQREFDNLCELSCDETVVKRLDIQQRKQYGLLLLDFIQFNKKIISGWSNFSLNNKRKFLEKRLRCIVKGSSISKCFGIVFLALFSIVCFVGCGTSATLEKQLPDPQGFVINEHTKQEASLSEIEKQDQIDLAAWKEKQKPIKNFSWEKPAEEERTILFIDGKVYTYKFLENGCLVASKDMPFYWEALGKLPENILPEDLNKFLEEYYR